MMRKHRISTILLAVGALTVLSSCQKQTDELTPQPDGEMVNVRFNTFLKEGDQVRPLNMGTRSAAGVGTRMIAGEGTLANGFYLYGHAHKLPFATSSGNTYTPIFENVKVNADGTYAIPKFWLQDKSLFYSFQAFAATNAEGEVGPGDASVWSGSPYVSSIPATMYLNRTDVLGAAVYDIKIGDEVPTVNLYFEHRFGKLSLQMQRMNAGGPTLYNLKMALDETFKFLFHVSIFYWAPGTKITPENPMSLGFHPSDAITLPASEMKPVEAHSFILAPQTIAAGAKVVLSYTLEPGAISDSNPEKSLKVTLPALPLESGKQLNVVIGHIVETEQIVVNSVTLTNWVAADKNVPEYGGYTPAGCFDVPIGGSFPNTYVALVDDVAVGYNAAKTNCANWGGRLPTQPELRAMYDNRLKYGTFVNNWYWGFDDVQYPFVMNMVTGATSGGNVDNPWNVRCVKDRK